MSNLVRCIKAAECDGMVMKGRKNTVCPHFDAHVENRPEWGVMCLKADMCPKGIKDVYCKDFIKD